MSNQTPASKDDARWAKQDELQRGTAISHGEWPDTVGQTLQSLRSGRDRDNRNALRYLAQWLHITVEDTIVKISATGTARSFPHLFILPPTIHW